MADANASMILRGELGFCCLQTKQSVIYGDAIKPTAGSNTQLTKHAALISQIKKHAGSSEISAR